MRRLSFRKMCPGQSAVRKPDSPFARYSTTRITMAGLASGTPLTRAASPRPRSEAPQHDAVSAALAYFVTSTCHGPEMA
ncbi:MAG: hypothetical protein JXQ29_08310, partial [Planctomycetes bacterium]|nr:hypothetical protein [Planctomycetota bacterium]